MASFKDENSLNYKDKYNKGKFKEDKRSSRSTQHGSSRYESPSNSRKRSPPNRTGKESGSDGRDRLLDDRKMPYTEDHRTVYRSDDRIHRNSERYRSRSENLHHSNSHDDPYSNKKSLERDNYRSKERDHHRFNERHQHHSGERDSQYVSKEAFVHQEPSEESYDDQYAASWKTKRNVLSDRAELNDENSSEVYNNHKMPESYRPYSEENSHKQSDERHISFRKTAAPGDEEFVASLLQKIDFLSNQVDCLTQENEKLKYSKNNMKNYSSDSAEVTIIFGNKKFEEKFTPILKELATDLITGRCNVEALSIFLESTDVSQKRSESWNPEGEIFSLDISCEEPKQSSSSVPKYDRSFSEVLQSPDLLLEENAQEGKGNSKIPKNCFNCEGNHFINQCPIPLDYRKIANARKRVRSSYVSNKRYHVCGIQESDYKPGIISEKLRTALDLQMDQVPPYIYRMRILDYPPGWMAEASVESSGIALYGTDGIAQIEESDKDGNLNVTGIKVQYDPEKLIDYPGFNAPLPPNFIDESSALGLPAMQLHQMRNYVEQILPKPDAAPSRKRKLDLPEPQKSKSMRCEEDMDIDNEELAPAALEFNPPLPQDAPPPPPEDYPESPMEDSCSQDVNIPPPSGSDSLSGTNTPVIPHLGELASIIEPLHLKGNLSPTSGHASPSLRELEEMKKRLVIELGISTESSNSALLDGFVSNDEEEDDSLKIIPTFTLGNNSENLDNDLSNLSDSSFLSDTKPSGAAETSVGLQRTESVGSKLVSLGTPSISRHSSFTKLPSYDNFSKDVTSHLNFENLPNSTGTYERMKKVIKRVKAKISSIM